MFLRILKSNPILLLIFTILTCIGIGVWTLLTKQVSYSGNMPVFYFFFGWAVNVKLFSVSLGLILLLVQAFGWNAIINSNTLLRQSSYFPAFFLILLASCRLSLISIYPVLFASLFLTLAMRRLIASYKKDNAISNVFDAGLFIGIGSLFYPPFVVFMLFLWIAVLIMRSLIWREWVVAMVGFVLPFGFAMAYQYLFFVSDISWYSKLILSAENYRTHFSFNWKEWMLMLILAGLSIASFWLFINKMADNIVKTQKVWALILWFMVFALVSVVILKQRDAQSFMVLAIPFSFIFSNYFLKAKSAIWAELLFLCLLISIGLNLFF